MEVNSLNHDEKIHHLNPQTFPKELKTGKLTKTNFNNKLNFEHQLTFYEY